MSGCYKWQGNLDAGQAAFAVHRRNADHETCRLQDMKAANYYWFQESAKGISEARKRSWEGADIPYPVLAELAGAVIWRCHPFTLDTDKNYLFRLLRTVAK